MDKLDMAVARLKEASEISLFYYKQPLLLTYSGGKDSDAVQLLADGGWNTTSCRDRLIYWRKYEQSAV